MINALKSLISSHPRSYFILLKNPNNKHLLDFVISKTKKLDDSYSLATKVYWTINELSDFPICPTCKNKFGMNKNISIKSGYSKFCSIQCFNKSTKKDDVNKSKKKEVRKKSKSSKRTRFIPENVMFGRSQEEVVEFCLENDFPGNSRWPTNNPIWDCNIANRKTPKEAWKDKELLEKAVYNLYWIVQKGIRDDEYHDFNEVHKNALINKDFKLLQLVLNRFTIAKIAPKVTALSPNLFLKGIDETVIDISNGVYCPMAGFGGIVEGSKRWFKKHKIKADVEAYDVNKNFCDFYGWGLRDVLAQKIETDKVVVVCPPFGKLTEVWSGTDDKFYLDMEDWCLLIKEYVKAPRYIFFGPNKLTEEDDAKRFASGIKPNGLFRNKVQASCMPYHEKYSYPNFTEKQLIRLKEIKEENPWILNGY